MSAVQEQALRQLRERGLRVTPQRRAIWAAFENGAAGHLTADAVFQRARRDLPELSRATTYNALSEFVSAGLLRVLSGHGGQLYDPKTESHHHFRCRSCQRLLDVQPQGVERLRLDDFFQVEETQILFEGLCGDCRPPSGDVRDEVT
jgi:Fe2+ or Zn2+ uptake regulation protein